MLQKIISKQKNANVYPRNETMTHHDDLSSSQPEKTASIQ